MVPCGDWDGGMGRGLGGRGRWRGVSFYTVKRYKWDLKIVFALGDVPIYRVLTMKGFTVHIVHFSSDNRLMILFAAAGLHGSTWRLGWGMGVGGEVWMFHDKGYR